MRRSGFTLIEVLVALALAALVVTLAHRVFTAVIAGAGRVEHARNRLDREANAQRWLAEAFGSLAAGPPPAGPFDGEPHRVTFTTWLQTPTGGFAPVAVELALGAHTLVARLGPGPDSLVLARHVAAVGFDYLLLPGATARWVGEWLSPVSAPLAVRLRVRRARADPATSGAPAPPVTDTLLLLIGARG